MSGYTTTFSIDMINEICDHPSQYKTSMIQQALNDAETHYKYGNVSKSWLDYVTRILSSHL